MKIEIEQIGDFFLTWGESPVWDDLANRLYFVDCTTHKLHWLENAKPPLHSMVLPSMPTAVVLSTDERVVVALADGLFLIDPDANHLELLTRYPSRMGKRANDATVDPMGNIVTGSLKELDVGSYWQYSSNAGWKMLDSGISNANGPVVSIGEQSHRLVFADTPAQKIYAYDYDLEAGTVARKRVFADTTSLGGYPDGASLTSEGDILSCIYGGGIIAQFSEDGSQRTFSAGSEQPSAITFGGNNLDRLFVTSIRVDFGFGKPVSPLAGALLEIRNTGLTGAREARFQLTV